MSKYARIRVGLEISDYSDYSRPRVAEFEDTLTPDEFEVDREVECETTGTTIATTNYTTVTRVIIRNMDTTNYVSLVYRSIGGGGAAVQTQRIAAGRTLILTDFDPATSPVLTANTAPVLIQYSITGT
jgi:hypothetical protein